MIDCWQEVKKLQGQTLKTLDQRKSFDILGATYSCVEIFLHSKKSYRKIYRQEIEGACDELKTRREITRSEIEERHSPRNPAYVAAILATLPGVGYSLNPIRLFY